MKNHIATTVTKMLICAAVLVTTASCVSDFKGQAPDPTAFTEDNYLYEGDLYRIYLEERLAQADENTGDDLIAFWKKELLNIIDPQKVGLEIVPPIPPCPKPTECAFEALEYLIVDSKVTFIEVLFYNANNEIIGGGEIDELSPMPDTDDLLSFTNLKIENYQEIGGIKVTLTNQDGSERSYFQN